MYIIPSSVWIPLSEAMRAWQNGPTILDKTPKNSKGKWNGGVYVNFKGKEHRNLCQNEVANFPYVSTEQLGLNMLKANSRIGILTKVSKDAFNEWNSLVGPYRNWRWYRKTNSPRFLYGSLACSARPAGSYSDLMGNICDMNRRVPTHWTKYRWMPVENAKIQIIIFRCFFGGAQWTINTLWHLVYPESSEGL